MDSVGFHDSKSVIRWIACGHVGRSHVATPRTSYFAIGPLTFSDEQQCFGQMPQRTCQAHMHTIETKARAHVCGLAR